MLRPFPAKWHSERHYVDYYSVTRLLRHGPVVLSLSNSIKTIVTSNFLDLFYFYLLAIYMDQFVYCFVYKCNLDKPFSLQSVCHVKIHKQYVELDFKW